VLLQGATLAIAAITLVTASPVHADKLAPDDLAKKNEGGYVTGLPLFAYSTDLGLGLGARGCSSRPSRPPAARSFTGSTSTRVWTSSPPPAPLPRPGNSSDRRPRT